MYVCVCNICMYVCNVSMCGIAKRGRENLLISLRISFWHLEQFAFFFLRMGKRHLGMHESVLCPIKRLCLEYS
jgi:hypothetical protein